MPHITPNEAINNRLSEIEIKSGNLIFNIDNESLLYDTSSNKRINLSSVIPIKSEKELTQLTGVPEKLFLAKDTGALYYWIGNRWYAIKIASDATIYDTFYVSESGSDDNDGVTANTPAKTINNILNKKANNLDRVNICILGGTFNENKIQVNGKSLINIYSEATNMDTMPVINSEISISNSNFRISSLKLFGPITIDNSAGKISACTINSMALNSGTGLELSNSLVHAEMVEFNNNTVAIKANNNSVCSVTNIRGTNNVTGYNVNNGSTVTVYGNNTMTYSENYILSNNGRIYLSGEEADESTKKFVTDKIKEEDTIIKTYTDTKVKETVDTAKNFTTDKIKEEDTNIKTHIKETDDATRMHINSLLSIEKVY